ncbi:hypothetical protein JB92DRAFT_175087 [Gautieria morchelliformis]|nr:hypothetical protein JB92DRAFT_175087 [Gautieria morchelliformis]
MHSPQVMSAHHLQPSPFSPDQFLTSTSPSIPASPPEYTPHSHPESSDEEMSSPSTFIKKRPLDITEDLVEGRFDPFPLRHRRRKSRRTPSRGCSEPPESTFAPAMDVEPTTPPNPPRSPVSFLPRDMPLSRAAQCLSHSPQSRRTPQNRRSVKVKSPCPTSTSKYPRESSPALVRSRSPLGRWTPPAVSTFQLFSVQPRDLPVTPPPTSSYSFDQQPHGWSNNFPWTVPSPSTSPYPSHSPPPHAQHQA